MKVARTSQRLRFHSFWAAGSRISRRACICTFHAQPYLTSYPYLPPVFTGPPCYSVQSPRGAVHCALNTPIVTCTGAPSLDYPPALPARRRVYFRPWPIDRLSPAGSSYTRTAQHGSLQKAGQAPRHHHYHHHHSQPYRQPPPPQSQHHHHRQRLRVPHHCQQIHYEARQQHGSLAKC